MNRRGISPVVGVVLMIAITVLLAGSVATILLGVGDVPDEPAPIIGESSGELEQQSGSSGGEVHITHVAGDDIAVENIEIAVDASDACGEHERLINLPENDSNNAGRFDDTNVESGPIDDSIISGDYDDLGVLDSRTTNQFTEGSSLQFRLASSECELDAGDEVIVRVVHVPSDSAIITRQLTV